MKKFLVMAIVMVASLAASAQAHIGGSFGVARDITENETEFSILPEVGYCFNDKWGAGLGFGYQHSYKDGRSVNVGVVNPYARYTFFRTDNNLVSLFVDGGVDMSFGSTKVGDYSSDTVFVYGIGFKPGIAFTPVKKFTVLAHIGSLGYWGANDAGKDAGYTSHFGLNFNTLALNLGFYYNF